MSDDKPPVMMKQEVVPLSGGWYMVRHVSKEMCLHVWNVMDEYQRNELRALYGEDDEDAKKGMCDECSGSEHQAAFFDGTTLVCVMWADWVTVRFKEDGGRQAKRVIGCFCNSEYALNHTMSFAKKTPECRDAFELYEPSDVSELYVFIANGYEKSKKWAVMFGGMEKVCDAWAGEHQFVCYKRPIGGR